MFCLTVHTLHGSDFLSKPLLTKTTGDPKKFYDFQMLLHIFINFSVISMIL